MTGRTGRTEGEARGREGKKGKGKRRRKISCPRSFLKVGAYIYI